MKVQSTYRGRTYKEVTIEGIADDRPVSDDLLAGFAMASIGENPSSLFGWSVTRPSMTTTAVVTLNTD
jgi:hypothetical protein